MRPVCTRSNDDKGPSGAIIRNSIYCLLDATKICATLRVHCQDEGHFVDGHEPGLPFSRVTFSLGFPPMMMMPGHDICYPRQEIADTSLLNKLIQKSKVETTRRTNGDTAATRRRDGIMRDDDGKECNSKGREPKDGCFDSHG